MASLYSLKSMNRSQHRQMLRASFYPRHSKQCQMPSTSTTTLVIVGSFKGYFLQGNVYKYDTIPEFLEGHNAAGFIDSDIAEKLKALEIEKEPLSVNSSVTWDKEISNLDLCNVKQKLKVYK